MSRFSNEAEQLAKQFERVKQATLAMDADFNDEMVDKVNAALNQHRHKLSKGQEFYKLYTHHALFGAWFGQLLLTVLMPQWGKGVGKAFEPVTQEATPLVLPLLNYAGPVIFGGLEFMVRLLAGAPSRGSSVPFGPTLLHLFNGHAALFNTSLLIAAQMVDGWVKSHKENDPVDPYYDGLTTFIVPIAMIVFVNLVVKKIAEYCSHNEADQNSLEDDLVAVATGEQEQEQQVPTQTAKELLADFMTELMKEENADVEFPDKWLDQATQFMNDHRLKLSGGQQFFKLYTGHALFGAWLAQLVLTELMPQLGQGTAKHLSHITGDATPTVAPLLNFMAPLVIAGIDGGIRKIANSPVRGFKVSFGPTALNMLNSYMALFNAAVLVGLQMVDGYRKSHRESDEISPYYDGLTTFVVPVVLVALINLAVKTIQSNCCSTTQEAQEAQEARVVEVTDDERRQPHSPVTDTSRQRFMGQVPTTVDQAPTEATRLMGGNNAAV